MNLTLIDILEKWLDENHGLGLVVTKFDNPTSKHLGVIKPNDDISLSIALVAVDNVYIFNRDGPDKVIMAGNPEFFNKLKEALREAWYNRY